MWVRGLKRVNTTSFTHPYKSHPMWVRGLKLISGKLWFINLSRTLCGCVD